MKDSYDYIRKIYQAIPSATLVGAMVLLLRIKPRGNESLGTHARQFESQKQE